MKDKDMKDKVREILSDLNDGRITVSQAQDQVVGLFNPSNFEKDLFKLINSYAANGLSKPDLVSKMQYITKSCEMS